MSHATGFPPGDAGNNAVVVHHIDHVHPGPVPRELFHRRGYGTTVIIGQNVPPQRSGVQAGACFGVVLLAVGVILIFCGIPGLKFSEPSNPSDHGIQFKAFALFGFGGVMFSGGLLFTIGSWVSMKEIIAQEKQTQYETACNPPKQLENKVEFSQSPGNDETSQPPNSAAYGQSPGKAQPNRYASSVPLQVSGPPSYVEAAAVYPGQAPESSSTPTPYPPIGFVVPSVANH